jgi:hypothetical protein
MLMQLALNHSKIDVKHTVSAAGSSAPAPTPQDLHTPQDRLQAAHAMMSWCSADVLKHNGRSRQLECTFSLRMALLLAHYRHSNMTPTRVSHQHGTREKADPSKGRPTYA